MHCPQNCESCEDSENNFGDIFGMLKRSWLKSCETKKKTPETERFRVLFVVETTELEGDRAGAGSCSPIPARIS